MCYVEVQSKCPLQNKEASPRKEGSGFIEDVLAPAVSSLGFLML